MSKRQYKQVDAGIGATMIFYLLKGERNLSYPKAKLVAEQTGTDPAVWQDPERVSERRPAWEKTFGGKGK